MSDAIANSHNEVLNHIITASENSQLQITEDIYDQSGTKLLAKGYTITPKIRDKILNKALKKPIETCLTSDSLLSSEELSEKALSLIPKITLLKDIFPTIEDEAKAITKLNIEPLALMLLTIMKDSEPAKLQHTLIVTLIARSIATAMSLNHKDIINLSLSSLLHDIGELYTPMPKNHSLSVHDWRNIMSHPLIGSSIVKLYMQYPPEVSVAILEHHERCDGTGYPQKIDADVCSMNGQILIISEAAAGLINSTNTVNNMIISFRSISDVYPRKPLAIFNSMFKHLSFTRSDADTKHVLNGLKLTLETLYEVENKVEVILEKPDIPKTIRTVVEHLQFRLKKLLRSVYDTGIHFYTEDNHQTDANDDQTILLELEASKSELRWQIQDLLRDLTLRLVGFRDYLPDDLAEVTEQLAQASSRKTQ